jgi:hypothetical protein
MSGPKNLYELVEALKLVGYRLRAGYRAVVDSFRGPTGGPGG